MPRYFVLVEGAILVPAIFIFEMGRFHEGFRKMTSSVLAALRDILLARSHL